jgi:molecular chaperone GrpE
MSRSKDKRREIPEEQPAAHTEDTLVPLEPLHTAEIELPVEGDKEVTKAGAEDNKIENLIQALEEKKQQAAENLDKARRALAELDNLRKRTTRDIENAHKYALEKFVTDLLPIVDSMELGLSASAGVQDVASLREGMELTLKMFATTLERFGVRAIDPQGGKFNPESHQAVSMQEQEGAAPGTVICVMQKGYELNGRLIRPAMVIVAR